MTGRSSAGVAAAIVISALSLSRAQSPAPAAGNAIGNQSAGPCTHSPICAWGRERNLISHEMRKPDLGFTYAYPFALPGGRRRRLGGRDQFEGASVRLSAQRRREAAAVRVRSEPQAGSRRSATT